MPESKRFLDLQSNYVTVEVRNMYRMS